MMLVLHCKTNRYQASCLFNLASKLEELVERFYTVL